jgi:hypothetical protein
MVGQVRMNDSYRLLVNRALFALVLFALWACAVAPGKIKVSESPFDGARETALDPAYVCSGKPGQACFIRLGLFKRSTMAPDSVILIVVADASNPIIEGESLYFGVNGRVIPLASIDGHTGYAIGRGPHTTGAGFCGKPGCSVKRYLIDRALLKALLDAPEVSMRVMLKSGPLGAELSGDDPGLALPSFREFYARVFGP